MRAHAFLQGASSQEILRYIKGMHPAGEFKIDQVVTNHPEWELAQVPVSQIKIPDIDTGENQESPHGQNLFIDYDYVNDLTLRDVQQRPIVIDPDGWVIDGNHRAVKAKDLGLETIKVWRPARPQNENFADGKVKGKSRPGRVKRAGASCDGSVTELRAKAKNASGEKARMYHWCANMKSGKQK